MPGRLKALEGVVERCLEAPQNWAQPLYYQKVFKTERFRYDSVMVLDSYQFREISRNREEPWPIPPQCPVPYAGRAPKQPHPKGIQLSIKFPPLPNQPRIPTAAGPFALQASLPKTTGAERTRQLIYYPYTLTRLPPTQYILSGGIRSAT